MATGDDDQRRAAAEYAARQVESGMIVGLGMGRAATAALTCIAARLRDGSLRDILGIPCGRATEDAARRLGVPLTTLDEHPEVDLTIDGADEVDPALNLIKGAGGALLREKIVAQASRREIIVVEERKLSPALGTNWAVPIEVVSFGLGAIARYIESIGGRPVLRAGANGIPVQTDQGNVILDCRFGPLSHPEGIAELLERRAGIVEHGLFLGLASEVVVGGADDVRVLHRPASE